MTTRWERQIAHVDRRIGPMEWPSVRGQLRKADLSTTQGTAAMLVMKKALDAQASGAMQLIAALPQPALATSRTVGTKVNTFA